jgi:hypothetical protein
MAPRVRRNILRIYPTRKGRIAEAPLAGRGSSSPPLEVRVKAAFQQIEPHRRDRRAFRTAPVAELRIVNSSIDNSAVCPSAKMPHRLWVIRARGARSPPCRERTDH